MGWLTPLRLSFALSIALHLVVLFAGWLPIAVRLPMEDPKLGKPEGRLALRLAPPALPAPPPGAVPVPPSPAPTLPARPQAKRKPSPVKEAPQPPAAPPVLTRESPAPPIATPPPAPSASPPPVARAPVEDFAAAVAARRRAREAADAPPAPPPSPPGPAESERERHNRAVAANLGLDRTPTFGERPPGGGMFQLQNVSSEAAELVFYGWNKDIRRNARQVLSVRRGNNPSIELALVRRMIAIIRDHETGDFIWESPRLGRNLTLSARLADNAGLEDVLMSEFFPDYRARR